MQLDWAKKRHGRTGGAYRRTKRSRVIIAVKLYDKTGRSQIDGIIRFLCQRREWVPLFMHTEQELADAIAQVERDGDEAGISGLIIGPLAGDALTHRAIGLGLPMIVIAKTPKLAAEAKAPIVFACNDNVAIATVAAEHFFSLGVFRSYGYVPWFEPRDWCRERAGAFAECVRQAGGRMFTFAGGHETSLVAWLRKLPKPAAVLASCDRVATLVVEACADLGLDIPGQVAVVGIDDDEICCEATAVSLTSINKDDAELGYQVARKMTQLLKRTVRMTAQPPIVVRSARLVARESTAPLRPTARLIERALRFIRENASSGIDVGDVVRSLGVSRRLADFRFREMTGRTIHDAIIERRLADVKRMLLQTERSMSAIAAAAGFGSPNSLKKIFKQRFGQTMTQFRAANARA